MIRPTGLNGVRAPSLNFCDSMPSPGKSPPALHELGFEESQGDNPDQPSTRRAGYVASLYITRQPCVTDRGIRASTDLETPCAGCTVYRIDLGTDRALTLIRKLNECVSLNDQYLGAYSRKLTAIERRCSEDRIGRA
jgi:hypothetical protein